MDLYASVHIGTCYHRDRVELTGWLLCSESRSWAAGCLNLVQPPMHVGAKPQQAISQTVCLARELIANPGSSNGYFAPWKPAPSGLPVHGFYSLWMVGRPKGGIERTTVLVTVGICKHIRHPLYASLLYGACEVFLKDPSPLGSVLALATSVFSFLTARVEETEMLSKFGTDYATYMKRTACFVPFVF